MPLLTRPERWKQQNCILRLTQPPTHPTLRPLLIEKVKVRRYPLQPSRHHYRLRKSCPAKEAVCRAWKKGALSAGMPILASSPGGACYGVSWSTQTLPCGSSRISPEVYCRCPGKWGKIESFDRHGELFEIYNLPFVKEQRIPVLPYFGRVAKANSSLFSEAIYQCKVEVEMEGHTYRDTVMLVMKNLCSDAIIGHDVLQHHSSVEIAFHGKRPPLRICSLAVAQAPPVSLFANLTADCTPITANLRKHSMADSQFIAKEIKRLLREGVIEPSSLPGVLRLSL